MKQASSTQKTVSTAARLADNEPVAGAQGVALEPPAYGLDMVDQPPIQRVAAAGRRSADAPQTNKTGLPDSLKAGIEQLSGLALDDVRVHYNSAKPAQLQALAHTQGTEIHVGPGQERHLPHEAWHVVQQKQGRVKPTSQMQGVGVNEDAALEQEADVMGNKAVQSGITHQVEHTMPQEQATLATEATPSRTSRTTQGKSRLNSLSNPARMSAPVLQMKPPRTRRRVKSLPVDEYLEELEPLEDEDEETYALPNRYQPPPALTLGDMLPRGFIAKLAAQEKENARQQQFAQLRERLNELRATIIVMERDIPSVLKNYKDTGGQLNSAIKLDAEIQEFLRMAHHGKADLAKLTSYQAELSTTVLNVTTGYVTRSLDDLAKKAASQTATVAQPNVPFRRDKTDMSAQIESRIKGFQKKDPASKSFADWHDLITDLAEEINAVPLIGTSVSGKKLQSITLPSLGGYQNIPGPANFLVQARIDWSTIYKSGSRGARIAADPDARAAYEWAMNQGLIGSMSTGVSGVKKEPNNIYIVKIAIPDLAHLGGNIDNTVSLVCRATDSGGGLRLTFNSAEKRH